MTGYGRSLGSGSVEYRPDRRIIHFGTPPQIAEAQYAADRLRARGFILESSTTTEGNES